MYCVPYSHVLGRPTLVGKALIFTHVHSLFFLFYQSTVLSSRAVNGHQMYFGGKASTIGIEISPTLP